VDFKISTGALDEAKTMLGEITAKHPDYLPPRVYAMRIACTERQDEDCTGRVQNILTQDPINYFAVFQDGVLNLAKGDAAKAVREFEYLSTTYTGNPQVRYQLALAYLLLAKDSNLNSARDATDAAESRLNAAIGLDPSFEAAVLLFAELKIRKGSPAGAIDSLNELLKRRPESPQAHYLLASAYLAQQQLEPALRVYRQMTELFPKDPQPCLAGFCSIRARTEGPPSLSGRRGISQDARHPELSPGTLLASCGAVDGSFSQTEG